MAQMTLNRCGSRGPDVKGGVGCLVFLLLSAHFFVAAQDSFCKRIVTLEPVDGTYGTYRIVLELELSFVEKMRNISDAGEPTLFVGEQKIIHFLGFSGNLLTGFLRERPSEGDRVWYGPPDTAAFNVHEARAAFDAQALPSLEISNVQALLDASEHGRKRILEVEIETRTTVDSANKTTILYVVKLVVENCTAENFEEAGPFGRLFIPTVYVGEQAADSTFYSVSDELVIGEFSEKPEEGSEITLRYYYWMLTAPERFTLN